jgi:bla regulator protein BlaR1
MEALLNNLIQATGWSILHSLWQAAFIYALLLPSQMHVFQLKAKTKYNLAYGANVIIFICFAVTFFTVFKWPVDQSSAIMAKTTAYTDQTTRSILAATITQYAEKIFPFLVLLYGIGLLIQSFIVFKGYNKIQGLKKAARINIPEEWNTLFENLTKKMNISKHISFHLSDHVNVPLVIGFFKPVVLFPVALAAQMDIKHVEAILIHELSHIRRNDYVFNLIRTMIETILFFNPFVWLTGKFIDIEREHACDDLVVTLTNTPLTYAHALLQVELLADKSSPLFALAATGNNQHLYQRIKRITDMKTNYMNSKQKLFAVTLAIATIASLAWISPAKSEKQQKPAKAQKSSIMTAPTVQLPLDTGKKRLKNIIILKKPGEPDVIKSFDSVIINRNTQAKQMDITSDNIYSLNVDSIISPQISISLSKLAAEASDLAAASMTTSLSATDQSKLASMAASMEKKGMEIQRKFDSPAERAKWDKYADEMKAKYNSPEQKEKMKKMMKEAKQAGINAQNIISSPEFKNRTRVMINGKTPGSIVFLGDTEEQLKLKQTAEYKELKKKFDEDVEKLKAEKLKKDND